MEWLTDNLLSIVVLIVTAARWLWDRQLAKSLDLTKLRNSVDKLEKDVVALDVRVHKLTSERLPTLLRDTRDELVNFVDRELKHVRELIRITGISGGSGV